jgi:uncharacterized protein involved in oxidation of intracellular sulfur
MSEEEELLVVNTYGPENSEKCLMPFIVANAALLMDIKTTVFMMAGSVQLAVRGAAEKVPRLEGMPVLAELMNNFFAQGGEMKLCGPCCNHREITPDDLREGAEIGGASGLVDMIMGRKVVSF